MKPSFYLMTGAYGIVTSSGTVSYKNMVQDVALFHDPEEAKTKARAIVQRNFKNGGWVGLFENWGTRRKIWACDRNGETDLKPANPPTTTDYPPEGDEA